MSRNHLLAVASYLCATWGGGLVAHGEFFESGDLPNYRSIFIDRFDFTFNQPDVQAMQDDLTAKINQAADEGFTEIVFQVRGRGDALYNGNIEPQAAFLTPGFDPLQTALDASHARGFKLHAWFNATPMWNSNAINPPTGHIYHNDSPSLRLMDFNGNLEPQAGWSNYATANPILPEMHNHLNAVIADVATNYDVDGIHLDYIRFLPGTFNSNSFARMPHDPISHDMFRTATDPDGPGGPLQGLDGADVNNFEAYKTFLTDRITDLVASVKQNVDALEVSESRAMEVTASVFMTPSRAKNEYGQDWGRWIEEGLLDVAMPMLYLSQLNDNLFDGYLQEALDHRHEGSPTRVAPTLATYLHMDPSRGGGVALTLDQMKRPEQFGADGVGFYDFPAFFEHPLGYNYDADERAAVKRFFASGPGNVVDGFEANEGRFAWSYNQAPETTGLAATTSINRVTTEAQSGVAAQELNLKIDAVGSANWQLRHMSGVGLAGNPVGNAPLEPTGAVGFWLKTNEPGLEVRIAIDDPTSTSGPGASTLEVGLWLDVEADDKWHLYQWNLEDADQWDAYPGSSGADGEIDAALGSISIDSIFFKGSGHAQIYLDAVSHNPNGRRLAAVLVPGDFTGEGQVDGEDLAAWSENFGMTTGAELEDGDADADGDVDGADFLSWQRNVGGPAASATPVPEPASALLAGLALLGGWHVLAKRGHGRFA